MAPPLRCRLTVRALRDCGELMTSEGPRKVNALDVLSMKYADAEPLIRRGWLRQLVSDER